MSVQSKEKHFDLANEIRAWLKSRADADIELNDDTDLIKNEIIDSLRFVEFLLYIEDLRGRDIDEDDVDVDNFRSINTIKKVFFST
jgi:acyl carrier protein